MQVSSSSMRATARIHGTRGCPSVVRAQQQARRRVQHVRAAAGETASKPAELVLPRQGHMLISKTEVPSFIMRDDMMDQLYRWAVIEAAEGGLRNFGMPMKVEPTFHHDTMWGFDVEIIKEGIKKADMGINFDNEVALKYEWVGRDQEGFPQLEGNAEQVQGKYLEIWKINEEKVDEDTRSTIKALCQGLVTALNKYYAFGSVFAEDL